jgi:hypothetical protein
MPTLAERSLRVALTGVVPDDDPSIIADMQAEIERLRHQLAIAVEALENIAEGNISVTDEMLVSKEALHVAMTRFSQETARTVIASIKGVL